MQTLEHFFKIVPSIFHILRLSKSVCLTHVQVVKQGMIPMPKTHVNYLPLIDAKPSDPSTNLTSMMKAKRLTNVRGQHWVIYSFLGDATLSTNSYIRMVGEAAKFMLTCYNNSKKTLTDARIDTWKLKMRKSMLDPPKLCSLTPTSAAFHQNVLRANYQSSWLCGSMPWHL